MPEVNIIYILWSSPAENVIFCTLHHMAELLFTFRKKMVYPNELASKMIVRAIHNIAARLLISASIN